MSPGEVILMLASAVVALWAWGAWYWRQYSIGPRRKGNAGRVLLFVAPVLAAAVVIAVLETLASFDVRDDVRYLGLYFALGMAWVAIGAAGATFVGISARDDVLERGNRSVAYAIAGAIVALALCYAGGNVGDGPGWWVVLFASGLATLSLFITWLLLDLVSPVSDVVTIDRDPAAGMRLGAFLVACGAIFGRAAAGDWVSAEATVRDFLLVAQPVVPLLVIGVVVERLARPTREQPARPIVVYGVTPALFYLAVAAVHLFFVGVPE